MICQKCNTVNADGIRFCGNCGAPLVPDMTQPQQGEMPYGQPQAQQGGMPYGQPQAQAVSLQDAHPICRYHRTFALLRLLWLPLIFVSLFFGESFYVGWKLLGIVWSAAALLIALRAATLRFPKTGLSIAISVLGIISAIIINLFLLFLEYAGANF